MLIWSYIQSKMCLYSFSKKSINQSSCKTIYASSKDSFWHVGTKEAITQKPQVSRLAVSHGASRHQMQCTNHLAHALHIMVALCLYRQSEVSTIRFGPKLGQKGEHNVDIHLLKAKNEKSFSLVTDLQVSTIDCRYLNGKIVQKWTVVPCRLW